MTKAVLIAQKRFLQRRWIEQSLLDVNLGGEAAFV
jgi:hypothetical protein